MKTKMKFGTLGILLSGALFAGCEKETGWLPQNNTVIDQTEKGDDSSEGKDKFPGSIEKETILIPTPVPQPKSTATMTGTENQNLNNSDARLIAPDPEPDPWAN